MKKWSIILFLIAIDKAKSRDICPDGDPSFEGMYTAVFELDTNWKYCRDTSFEQCSHTGMRSSFVWFQNYERTELHNIVYAQTKHLARYSAYVYEVKIGNKKFICPYPIGYLWFNKYDTVNGFPPQEMLPTDHTDTSSTLDSCESNKKCSPSEFCDHVINRSFMLDHAKCVNGRKCNADDGCSYSECGVFDEDVPYVDERKKFCYKIPAVDGLLSDSAQYIAESDKIGLKMCNVDDNCGPGCKCHTTSEEKWADYDEIDKVRKEYRGMCIETIPFSQTLAFNYLKVHQYDNSSTAPTAAKFLPVDSNNKKRALLFECKKNSECPFKSQFCGYAYSLPEHPPSSDKYCYHLPEEHENLLVKPDEVDLVVCDTDEECGGKLCSIIPNRRYSSNDKQKMARGLCTTNEVVKKNNNMIIIIVVAIALVVAILVALVGGLVLFKKKSKQSGKKNKNGKKGKKGKKDKNKTSTSTTTKSMTMAGKSGMGTTI